MKMIRRLLTLPYRWWLRQELRWIENRIADLQEQHANHEATLRSWRAEAVGIRWQLDGRPSNRHGLRALRPNN